MLTRTKTHAQIPNYHPITNRSPPTHLTQVPTAIRAQVLRSLTVLLPRMQLADHASAVVHPLVRVLDGPVKELRKDALIALTSLANSLGSDFLLFLPLVRRTIKKRSMRDPVFERIVERLEAERVQGGNSGFNNAGQLGVKMTINPNPNPSPFTSVTDSPIGGSDDHLPGESQRGANRRRRSRDSNRDMDIRGNSLHGGYSLRHLSLANPSEGLVVDEAALRRAWESSQRSTKEDWLEWMRHLSVELLKQSPSPALRACIDLAMVQPHLARDLFCASFVSCWSELSAVHRDQLVRSLEAAFGSPTIPPEIVTTLLNLAEFCEHDEKPLPVDIRTLGMIAERCRAYAKALHYKETEFVSNPAGCVEAIIAINNQLQLPEAAMGVLVYAQAHLRLEIKEVSLFLVILVIVSVWAIVLTSCFVYRDGTRSWDSGTKRLKRTAGKRRRLNAHSRNPAWTARGTRLTARGRPKAPSTSSAG